LKNVSLGCVRLQNEDVKVLYEKVNVGDEVLIYSSEIDEDLSKSISLLLNFYDLKNLSLEKVINWRKKMDLNLIKDLVFVEGVSGFESKIRGKIKNEIEKSKPDDIKIDNLGNLIAIKKGKSDNFILFVAHMDELGLVVSAIDEDGLISFKKIGGIDDKILPSRFFRILGSKGEVVGVTGLLPPHLSIDNKTSENTIPWYNLKIDIGAKSKSEVLEKGIEVGTPIVFQKEFYTNDDLIISRGLDDRVGVYILTKILEFFKEKNHIIT